MGLSELQATLARLYTDSVFREQFYTAPETIGSQLGLNKKEIQQLQNVSTKQVNTFVLSLRHKRLGAVRHLLPRSAELLGSDFNKTFEDFSTTYVPQGVHKHKLDALAFANYLQSQKGLTSVAHFKDTLASESLALKLNYTATRIHWKRFQYPVWKKNVPLDKTIAPVLFVWFRRQTHKPWAHLRIGVSGLEILLWCTLLLCFAGLWFFPSLFNPQF